MVDGVRLEDTTTKQSHGGIHRLGRGGELTLTFSYNITIEIELMDQIR